MDQRPDMIPDAMTDAARGAAIGAADAVAGSTAGGAADSTSTAGGMAGSLQPRQPVYAVLSLLLAYPDAQLAQALPQAEALLDDAQSARLRPLLRHLAGADLIVLQEEYVATFDRRPAHSLYLFEHIHGASRDRGQAMVDLREEYLRHGLQPDPSELPDYVPMFLEFLAQLPADAARALLDDAIHVLARLHKGLDEAGSPYACVFEVLRSLGSVEPVELPGPPPEDEEETMVTFGPGGLQGGQGAEQPLRFYPPGGATRSHAGTRAGGDPSSLQE